MLREKVRGAKVQIITRSGGESYIGLITQMDGGWIELVPFAPEPVTTKYKDIMPDMEIIPISMTLYKRLDTIDTIIVLEKPDKEIYGTDNTESQED